MISLNLLNINFMTFQLTPENDFQRFYFTFGMNTWRRVIFLGRFLWVIKQIKEILIEERTEKTTRGHDFNVIPISTWRWLSGLGFGSGVWWCSIMPIISAQVDISGKGQTQKAPVGKDKHKLYFLWKFSVLLNVFMWEIYDLTGILVSRILWPTFLAFYWK